VLLDYSFQSSPLQSFAPAGWMPGMYLNLTSGVFPDIQHPASSQQTDFMTLSPNEEINGFMQS
jgi:hypothetical protein